jgi:hypothetical protein
MSHKTSGGDHSGETMSTFSDLHKHTITLQGRSASPPIESLETAHICTSITNYNSNVSFPCILLIGGYQISSEDHPLSVPRTGHCVRFRGGVATRGFAFCFTRFSCHQPTPRVETQTFPDVGPWIWRRFAIMRFKAARCYFPRGTPKRPNEYQFSVPRTCNAVGEARPDIPVGKHFMDHKMATSFTTSFTDIDFEMVLGGDESRPRIS